MNTKGKKDSCVMQLKKIMLFDSVINDSETEDSDGEDGPINVIVAKQNSGKIDRIELYVKKYYFSE